jgi:hypothetical protein
LNAIAVKVGGSFSPLPKEIKFPVHTAKTQANAAKKYPMNLTK